MFESRKIVDICATWKDLQVPERALLQQLRPDLLSIDLLDIGVGAGRTSRFFAPLVKSYLGVDYSNAMIERCRADLPAFNFALGDARHLDFVGDETYDMVLFSFNGIDNLGASDRKAALGEMRRVLRPGGLMVFSSHNSNYLPMIYDQFRFRIQPTPRATLRSFKRATMFWIKNLSLGNRLPLAVGRVHDGSYSFQSSPMYVRPDIAVEELRHLGMIDISCAGDESDEFMAADDPRLPGYCSWWVYYVCRKPPRN